MHIPDGYLSPSTCVVLYGASTPFWYVASERVKAAFNTRVIPLLSVFSAFCFVIMMFNLPLPGGTTGHAVGVGIAAVVLGPWASILAVSVALLIQAVFFGDGGITTLGANCFNMAIVGSWVAFLVYRALAGRSAITSPRRVTAAALAGYLAINASALVTAIELGLQPLFFKDPTGAPLYAPYRLGITIPAMMIGHLTFAGFAELILSGGIVAYLQRTNPSLLTRTAPGARPEYEQADEVVYQESRVATPGSGWRATRPLWTAVALLLLLTPLGILAAGAAWGEWSAQDFSKPAIRQKIALASGNVAPPAHAPLGLTRLYSVWSAPLRGYAPSFVRRPSFGYLLSAMSGAGIIILLFLAIGWLAARNRRAQQECLARFPAEKT